MHEFERELALAVFVSTTGTHPAGEPSARAKHFVETFDAQAYDRMLRGRGYRFVPRSSGEFPQSLREIHEPPFGLFIRGDFEQFRELNTMQRIAVVGARACSGYGASVARMLGRELAAAGVVVVSGLARGIDAEAHRGALEITPDGEPTLSTIAVLGCGIARDYPAAHAELARRVASGGSVVSEYAPGVEPAPWRFPARNRIIAGLCSVTVVVEAREQSGALITADLALEAGREVLAVPGEIGSALSYGTNALLKMGAKPLTETRDALDAAGIAVAEVQPDELGLV